MLSYHLPRVDANEEDKSRRALLLLYRYQTVLRELLEHDSLNGLSDRLIERCPSLALAFDPYDEAIHIGTKNMQAAYDAGDISYWPVYISLMIPHHPAYTPEEGQDDKKPTLPTLSLTLDLLAMREDRQGQARELAKSYGLSPKRRWAYKRVELPSEEAALNDTGRLVPWINEMCAIARELGY